MSSNAVTGPTGGVGGGKGWLLSTGIIGEPVGGTPAVSEWRVIRPERLSHMSERELPGVLLVRWGFLARNGDRELTAASWPALRVADHPLRAPGTASIGQRIRARLLDGRAVIASYRSTSGVDVHRRTSWKF